MKCYGIVINHKRDDRLTEQALKLLKSYYLEKEETSPQEAFARAAVAYSGGDMGLAQRIYNYVSEGWFMFSSPILSNAPKPEEKHVGLPISCFLSYVPDTVGGLAKHHEETAWLSVKGGGVGGHWADVRGITEKSPGVLPMLKVSDAQMTAFKQGRTRKGSYAAYLDIDHPDIIEFINFKVPTGGDSNRKCFNLFNAVNLTDAFMRAVLDNADWELKCPHTGTVTDTLRARNIWERLLEVRFRTGSPYLNFIDTANKALPDYQKAMGLKVHGSNLCNEIHLATSEDRTAVCCLSSVNLEHYPLWKETTMVQDLIEFLDNVLQAFVDNAPEELSKAKYSAMRERSLGLGAMGFHSLLMSKNIAWESREAADLNREVFEFISEGAKASTRKLAVLKGVAPDAAGYSKVRNAHLLAIAPNANSSILCGTSASIEPIKANVYTHRTRAGADVIKIPHLVNLLESLGKNTEEEWVSIMQNEGSVQHLDYLTDHQKGVFKTSFEIDQLWVVKHAADRQEFICQGQSVNLFFPSGSDRKYVNKVHLQAWKSGLKGLYYLRTTAGRTADKVGQSVERHALKDDEDYTVVYGKADCPWCKKACDLFSERGMVYMYIDIGVAGVTAADVTGRDVTTVPQIYVGGKYIENGYQGLVEFLGEDLEDDEECVACQG